MGVLRFKHDVPNIKKQVATVSFGMLCVPKGQIKHHKPFGMLQPLEVPKWEWDNMVVDFDELPRTVRKFEIIWVAIAHRYNKVCPLSTYL